MHGDTRVAQLHWQHAVPDQRTATEADGDRHVPKEGQTTPATVHALQPITSISTFYFEDDSFYNGISGARYWWLCDDNFFSKFNPFCVE